MSLQILWTVDHLVERRGWEPDALDRDGAADPGLLKRARFVFDWREAEREIGNVRAALDGGGALATKLGQLALGTVGGARLGEALYPEEGRAGAVADSERILEEARQGARDAAGLRRRAPAVERSAGRSRS